MKGYLTSLLIISSIFAQSAMIGGYNMSKVEYNNEDTDDLKIDTRSGFNLGFETRSGNLIAGASFVQRGSETTFNEDGLDFKSDLLLNYAALHLLIPIPMGTSLEGFGGLQAGFSLGGISKSTINWYGYTETVKEDIETDEFDVDAGLLVGANIMLNESAGIRASYYLGLTDVVKDIDEDDNFKNNTISLSLIFKGSSGVSGKGSSGTSFAGPSAKPGKKGGGSFKRPGRTGSTEIDDYVDSAFDLYDNLTALKTKLDDVSGGLKESNDIISEISGHPDGAVGWASTQLAKGTSKAINNLKTINISAGLDGLNPTQKLRKVLQTLKSGIVDGKNKLETIPDDLNALANDAKNLISSASTLPQAAKSLGMKAPKALGAIKNASGVLKNIPGEVSALSSSAQNLAKEMEQFMQNIENLLNG